ncbi:hypothetical protein JHN55_03785 [Streptomyces sp. MBT56]|uniref:hypothetical protein n=1 Tax=unclassified Streptomyces TaxID=2593676 RepID=UPI00190DF150|nr:MULTISPECIES: hypothetical protein [unclassified Streptomyces]MBK3555680.1 hypothetical protein [Streptomyces sp. MBT56]MBK3617292.1 hypothetical protein [Streptomyces sp. MBT98]
MYPTLFTNPGVKQFAEAIDAERTRQLAKFGEQHHRDGTSLANADWADHARAACQHAADEDALSWAAVLYEEFTEALAEVDPAKLRTELIQIAAVCAAWVHDLDSRTPTVQPLTPEIVSAILRDPNSPLYPSQITVFCDHCGVEATGDYMVSEHMTRAERLAVARKHLVDTAGWESTDDGDDFCPEHAGTPAA